MVSHYRSSLSSTLSRVFSDKDYQTWAASQRRPVEKLHCALYVVGSTLVVPWPCLWSWEQIQSWNPWDELCAKVLVLLHAACLLILFVPRIESFKTFLYMGIRAVAAGSFSWTVYKTPDVLARTPDILARYLEGTILRVVVCQTGLRSQVLVWLAELLVVSYCVSFDWKFIMPPLVSCVLELFLFWDYKSYKKSKSTEPVFPKGDPRAEPVHTAWTSCAQEAGGSGVITNSCSAPPAPAAPREVQSMSSEPKLQVDISRLFQQSRTSSSAPGSFYGYKPVVAVRSKTIKVFNKDATEAEIQRCAEEFASTIASTRKENGKLTVVKGVGIRGCILLMAGVMDNELRGPESKITDRDSFDVAAQDLINCLPEDMRGLDMDVTIDGMTGRFVQGQQKAVSIWEVAEQGVALPEVVLVSEPCAVMNKDTNLHICLSESEGAWESMKAVLVLGDEVQQTKELDSSIVSFQVHGSDEHKSGYIRTVGVTKGSDSEGGKTIVSSIAPFLKMPKAEAQELNGLFDLTVLEAMKAGGSTHEKQSKNVWKDQFKPFALDMQYIMDLDAKELRLLMSDEKGDDLKWEYLDIFQRLVNFLKECDASHTHRYLQRVLDDAGIELVMGDACSESIEYAPMPETRHKTFNSAAGPSTVPKGSKFEEHSGSDCDSALGTDFNFWRGFEDPALEAQYKLHLSQNVVLVDFVGIIMGLCLLPIMWQFIKDGDHLYLCPLMTHFLVCTSWFLCSERTYVHSRQPVVVLLWVVRMAVFVGQVAYKGWHTLVVSSAWNMAALGAWFVLVKPRVMKMALNDFLLLSLLDLACWLGIVIISFICEDIGAGVKSFGLALFCIAASCTLGYFSEKEDRNGFAASIEGAKPSTSK